MAKLKLAIVVGSNRRESINRKLAQALAKLGSDAFEPSFVQIDDLPMFNQDLEPNRPESTLRLKREIEAADAILIVTPEHNRSIPAVLKNAIDWASRPYGTNSFAHKPSAVIGTSPGSIGTAVAQQNLRSVLGFCNSPQMNAPEAYIQFTPGLITDNGEVTNDSTAEFLRNFMQEFHTFIARVRSVLPKDA